MERIVGSFRSAIHGLSRQGTLEKLERDHREATKNLQDIQSKHQFDLMYGDDTAGKMMF